jgi:glycosyltransferase involved in cell wall biosynthesis
VRYVESPDDEQVNELFCQATVFVQTSVHEGFALPPLEAMATGAAVVCTDAHGNRDFCVDGVNCLMPEANAGAMSSWRQRSSRHCGHSNPDRDAETRRIRSLRSHRSLQTHNFVNYSFVRLTE